MTQAGAQNANERWQVADLTVDVGSQSVSREGGEIVLPQLSFRFLLALVREAPNVLSADRLMDLVWTGIFVNSETVTQRAKLLRDALGDDPKDPRYFAVRRGSGYRLLPVPQRLDSSDLPIAAKPPARRWKLALIALFLGFATLTGLAAFAGWPVELFRGEPSSVRVAVLAFDNLSSDPADEFIARSIPEIVLNRLSSMRGLSVISRDSALLGTAASADPQAAGRRLEAAYVIKGSVQRLGQTLRVTCFVVDTSSGSRLWSERFDWPVQRLYALQDRIAERVAASLQGKVRSLRGYVPPRTPSRNPDAYLAYLRGKALLGRFTVTETDAASLQFARAVQLDPNFAEAMVSLYDAEMQGAELRKQDLAPVRARFGALLDRALELDPQSGQALFAQAMWAGLPREERLDLFRRAVSLDPSNSRGMLAFVELLEWDNTTRDNRDWREGEEMIARIQAIDPLGPRVRFWVVQRQLGKLTPDQIEQEQLKVLQLDPQNYPMANRYAMRRWRVHGDTAQAIALMEKVIASDPQNPWGPHGATAFYLDVGDLAAAQAVAATTPASRDSTRPMLDQYRGDWHGAAQAALGPRGFLFNQFENYLWAESVRDDALHGGDYLHAAEAIAARYGFDLANPRPTNLQQTEPALSLAQLLMLGGRQEDAKRLLVENLQWLDSRPAFGLNGGNGRSKAGSLMLLGQRDQALSVLRASVESGFDCRHWWYLAERDPVWAPVHADPRFGDIIGLCRQRAEAERAKLDLMRRQGKVPVRSGGR